MSMAAGTELLALAIALRARRPTGLRGRRAVAVRVHLALAVLPRLQHDLDALVLLVAEHAEAMRRFVERQLVGDQERRVDLATLDALEQRTHVALHVRLTRAE